MHSNAIEVLDQSRLVTYTFDEIMKYHGPGSPGGVAHAVKIMERALPLLGPDGPVERREITVRTAFAGPGARDAFEMVTRAVTDGSRYVVDPTLRRPSLGRWQELFVFRLGYRNRSVTATLRAGFVVDEFIDLVTEDGRSADEEARLNVLKQEMADRVMASPAVEVYDVDAGD